MKLLRWITICTIGLGAWTTLASAQQPGGVLRVGMQTDPVGLDPHTTNATATRNMLEERLRHLGDV